MLAQILRRLLSIPPALCAVSLICFLFVSYLPEPEGHAESRARFAGLPRFLNLAPLDAKARAERAIATLAKTADDPVATNELVRLGTAGLPLVIPALDRFTPADRGTVALALLPIAERMGLRNLEDARSREKAPLFWSRLLDDRSAEWAESAVRTKVSRLVRYPTPSRFDEVRALDTLALGPLVASLEPPRDPEGVERARMIVDLVAHVTGRDDRIAADASAETAREHVTRLRRFWFIHRLDYLSLDGERRVSALFLETRFAKWMTTVFDARLSEDGHSVVSRLLARAPTSGILLFGAMLLAYPLGIALGAIAAARRGKAADFAVAAVVMVLYALPTAVVVTAFARPSGSLALGAFLVALGLVASPARQARSALLTQVSQDAFRSFLAAGHSRASALVKVLRTAALPLVSGSVLEPSMALGSVFVVEHALGLSGLGAATVEAVRAKDVAFLMVLSVLAATTTMLMTLASDLVQAALDPRSRKRFVRSGPAWT